MISVQGYIRKLTLAGLFLVILSLCFSFSGGFAAHSGLAAPVPTGLPYGTGYNGEGELGIGSYNAAHTPTAVQLPSGVTATAFSNGYYYDSLILGSDGNVYGTGYNYDSRSGDGTSSTHSTPVKTLLSAGVIATAISVGDYHSMALDSNGTVYGWGYSYYGEGGPAGTNSTPRR